MKISFLGAARTVTGSCYVLEACGHRFAVDCGMHQGNSAIEERNRDTDRYAPTALDAIFLTHAHIDHSGLMPRLVANGFSGPIYCTEATRALASIMLLDSAHIQEMEAQSKQKKYQRRGLKNPPKPLYTQDDATKTAQFFHTAAYHERLSPFQGLSQPSTTLATFLAQPSFFLR